MMIGRDQAVGADIGTVSVKAPTQLRAALALAEHVAHLQLRLTATGLCVGSEQRADEQIRYHAEEGSRARTDPQAGHTEDSFEPQHYFCPRFERQPAAEEGRGMKPASSASTASTTTQNTPKRSYGVVTPVPTLATIIPIRSSGKD